MQATMLQSKNIAMELDEILKSHANTNEKSTEQPKKYVTGHWPTDLNLKDLMKPKVIMIFFAILVLLLVILLIWLIIKIHQINLSESKQH